jgi:hypothetical protein
MAKLNWQKLAQQSKAQSSQENTKQDTAIWHQKIVMQNQFWMLGKHKGIRVSKLPVDYLCYISETFDKGSAYKQRADSELRKRYKQLNN